MPALVDANVWLPILVESHQHHAAAITWCNDRPAATRPPPLMIINEPEGSLHPDLMPPLAELVAKVSSETQVLIVTHSRELAAEVSARCDAKVVDLVSYNGETRQTDQGTFSRVWTFDGND